MNTYYALNYLIFSIFFTLFTLEIGVALLSVLGYDEYKQKIKSYLNPIWELEGTFAVLFLVNFIATYPNMLATIGSIYVAPVLIAGSLLILRNAFLVYSEYTGKPGEEKRYMLVYGMVTLIIAIVLIALLDSVISGVGVNLASNSLDAFVMFVNPFNLGMLFSLLLINMFVISVFFDVQCLRGFNIAGLVVGALLAVVTLNAFTGYIVTNLMQVQLSLVVLLLILGIGVFMYLKKLWASRYVILFWLFLTLNFFGRVQYPYIFGGALDVTNYMTNAAIETSILAVTAIGGVLLLIALGYFVYVSYIKKGSGY